MNLPQAFRLDGLVRLALVGAGGKTTALFQLARELPPPVVVTTSTHLGSWQVRFADRHAVILRPEDIDRFAGQIEGVTLFTGPVAGENRLSGLDARLLEAVYDQAERLLFHVLVESDGSRQRPLKAPAEHEPATPDWVENVVVVAGLSGLGKPLDSETVHRPELFAALSGLEPGAPVTEEGLARLLMHPMGGLKNIPAGVRRILLLNQADAAEDATGGAVDFVAAGMRVATKVMAGETLAGEGAGEGIESYPGQSSGHEIPAYQAVVVASLENKKIWCVVEPTAGVILAGGGSSRYGQPKMLLDWHGKPIIRQVAETALRAGLNPLVVVTGAVDTALRDALVGLPVHFVHNPEWQGGQSTSLRKGVEALLETVGSALFLLADQPLISVDLIQSLIKRHQETLAPVVAPRVEGRRANPVLFDRVTFKLLQTVQGDQGGRAIFNQIAVDYLDWPDSNLLLDIDTPEDYRRLMGIDPL